MTTTQGYPQRDERVAVKDVGPGHALIGADPDGAHVVNDTALALWELCDGDTSVAEMVDAICTLFQASREQVATDVERTLGEFDRLGLIRWKQPG